MPDPHEPTTDASPLTLPLTGLSIEEGALRRKGDEGQTIATHRFDDITGVRLVTRVEPGCTILGVGAIVLAVVAKLYMASGGWGWAVAVMLVMLGAFFLSCARERRLRIESEAMSAEYQVFEDIEDAKGFVMTLMNEWRGAARRP